MLSATASTASRNLTMLPSAPDVAPDARTSELARAESEFNYLCRTMFRASPLGAEINITEGSHTSVNVTRTEHGSKLDGRINLHSFARLVSLGIHVAEDALVVRAVRHRGQSDRLGVEVYDATWVRQGRGLSVITERGWVFARRDGSGWGRSTHEQPRVRAGSKSGEYAAVPAPSAPPPATDAATDAIHASIAAELAAIAAEIESAHRRRERLLTALAVLDGDDASQRRVESARPPARQSETVRRAG